MTGLLLASNTIKLKEKANSLPKIFDDYLLKASNPSLTPDQSLFYIRKLKLQLTTMLGMLSDIEKEISKRSSR